MPPEQVNIALGLAAVRPGQHAAGWNAGNIETEGVGLAIALPAHYPYHLDTFGHLGLIYADTVFFLVGAGLAGRSLRSRQGALGLATGAAPTVLIESDPSPHEMTGS